MYKLIALALMMIGGLASAQQDYPLDQEMKSAFGSNSRSLAMTCKVTKVGKVYVYLYSIKNTSNKPMKVKWDIVSRVMYFGGGLDVMFDLEPDENAVFTLEHPEPPVQAFGEVTAFYLTTHDAIANMVKTPELPKEMKVATSKKFVYNSTSGTGALPKSWVMPITRK